MQSPMHALRKHTAAAGLGADMTSKTDLQELIPLAISRSISPEVHSSLTGMALAGHKHNGGLVCGMVGEG